MLPDITVLREPDSDPTAVDQQLWCCNQPLATAGLEVCAQMNYLISLVVFLVVSFGTPAVASTSSHIVGVVTSPEVVRAEFGLFNPPGSGKPAFAPVKVVPLVPNQGYGWIILLRTDKQKIKWREEFTLPAKPGTWGEPEPLGARSVSSDGRVSMTEREVTLDRGVIFNTWAVAPGDPKGHYVIRVFIEGTLARVFEFDVQ